MALDVNDIVELVKEKERETFQELYDQMDADYDIWNLKSRVFDDHKQYINVTSNEPRTYANSVMAQVVNSPRQISVKIPDAMGNVDQIALGNDLERFYEFAFKKADLRLRRLLEPNLLDAVAWYAFLRGEAAVRPLIYQLGDKIIFDIRALDPRHLTYEIGGDGVDWYAYTTYRTKKSIESEYKKDVGEQGQRYIEVIDYWDKKVNITCTPSEMLRKPKPHKLKRVPVVISPVATRPVIASSGEGILLKGSRESIMSSNREEYYLNDQLLSIAATHANLRAKMPMVNYFDPDQGGEPITQPVWVPGTLMNLPMRGNKIEELPFPDIPRSLETMIGQTQGRIQRGARSYVSFGQLSFELSGTALNQLMQTQLLALSPYLRAIDFLYEDICWLLSEQVQMGGYMVDVQGEDKEGKFYTYQVGPESFPDNFYIEISHDPVTSWMNLERLQTIEMGTRLGVFSLATAREEVAKLPDAQSEKKKILLEKLEEQFPELMIDDGIEALIAQGRMKQAAILGQKFQQMLQQTAMEGGGPEQGMPPPEGGMPEQGMPPPGGMPIPGASPGAGAPI